MFIHCKVIFLSSQAKGAQKVCISRALGTCVYYCMIALLYCVIAAACEIQKLHDLLKVTLSQ